MSTTLPVKSPGEAVTVMFDFSSETASVTGPVVSINLHSQVVADASPAAMLSGVASVGTNPAQVFQRIMGGLAPNDYGLLCTATAANGDILTVPAVLPVRALPV